MVDTLDDGMVSFSGGQDASKDPEKTPANAYYSGINVTTESGNLRPRWGVSQKKLTFPEGGLQVYPSMRTMSWESIFHGGKYQAQIPYSVGSEFYQIIIISGVMFLVNQETWEVTILELPEGDGLDPVALRYNWSPAAKYLVIFDFPSYPVIVEGLTVRRADPTNDEVPVSVLGTYNQNRLAIGNAGNQFTLGDPAGSLATPDAPITFTEIQTPASPYFGQIFDLSTNYNNDPITAMTFLQVTDTSTGIGPLLVSTPKAIYSYMTQQPRSAWENGQFGTNFVFNEGIAGPQAFDHVGSDVFFTGSDAQVRSLSMSRNEQGKWSKVPMSREVRNWIGTPEQDLIPYSVVGYFQNKIFVTVNPFRILVTGLNNEPVVDVAFGGFAVLETDNLSNLTSQSQPSWAGLWTGFRPMSFCENDTRAFFISKDETATNQLYEFLPQQTYDTVQNNEIRLIRSRIYTRAFNFNSPFTTKSLHSLDFGISGVRGKFKLDVEYRPLHAENYVPFQSFKHEAPWRACTTPRGCEVNGFAPHAFLSVNMGAPNDNTVCDPATKTLYYMFRKVQFKITIEGIDWRINEFLARSTPVAQSNFDNTCQNYGITPVCQQCNDDWAIPEISRCLSNQLR